MIVCYYCGGGKVVGYLDEPSQQCKIFFCKDCYRRNTNPKPKLEPRVLRSRAEKELEGTEDVVIEYDANGNPKSIRGRGTPDQVKKQLENLRKAYGQDENEL